MSFYDILYALATAGVFMSYLKLSGRADISWEVIFYVFVAIPILMLSRWIAGWLVFLIILFVLR